MILASAPGSRLGHYSTEKRDESLVHSCNLGLLFRDPPSQRSYEILAENDARQRASDEVEEAWHDKPANMILMEKRKLTTLHDKQISVGAHRGRVNLITGLTEPYYVLDLPSPEELHEENVNDLPPRYARALQQAYEYIRSKSSVKKEQKINLYDVLSLPEGFE